MAGSINRDFPWSSEAGWCPIPRPTTVGLQLVVDGPDGRLGHVANGGVRQSRRVVDGQDDAAVLQQYVVAERLRAVDLAGLLVGAITQAGDLSANGVAAHGGTWVVVVVTPQGVLGGCPLDLDACDLVLVGVVVAERRLFTSEDVDVAHRVHCLVLADGLLDDVLADDVAHRLVRNPSGLREGCNGRSRLLGSGVAARYGRSALFLAAAAPAARGEEEGQGSTSETGGNSSCAGTHGVSRLLDVPMID